MMNILTAMATEPVASEGVKLVFQPMNFVSNLRYMGIGMLVIFAVIGVIALATVLINKIFSEK